jgi:hypothetical protein
MPNADVAEASETFTVLMDVTLADVPFVVQPYKVNFDVVKKSRYLHITAKRTPRRGWLFLDEVVVR